MILVKNLTKKFDNNEVLKGLDFSIKRGEIVGLLGPNGAGKTTTMRIITGYLSANKGKVLIDDKEIDETKEAKKIKKKIGYLPEDNPLYPEMLVEEYLKMLAELKQIPKDKRDKEIKKAVVKTGVEDVYYKEINDLSKGFRQRVGLAAAILGDPEILILDEPTEGLDPNQRIDIRNVIKNLGAQKTVIISSHVLQEIENTCERIIILNQGEVVADGKTKEIINGARGKKQLNLEIEGSGVKEQLEKYGKVSVLSEKNGRIKITLEAEKEVRPEVFNLAKKNNWMIWEMNQKEMSLEDVFRKLTK